MKTSRIVYTIALFAAFGLSKIQAQTVYIAETGKKYHSKSCPAVKDYKKEMQLSEAKKKGYEPCGNCGADKIVEEKYSEKKKEKKS